MEATTEKRKRTCIGCGKQTDKVQMFRLVRLPDKSVAYDPTGRVAGRGTYVCSISCFEDACKKKKVGRALKTTFGSEEAARIALELEEARARAKAR